MKYTYIIAAAVAAFVIVGIWSIIPSPFGLPETIVRHEIERRVEEALPQVPELPTLPDINPQPDPEKPSLIERIWPRKKAQAKPAPKKREARKAPEAPALVYECMHFNLRCVWTDPRTGLVVEEPRYFQHPVE